MNITEIIKGRKPIVLAFAIVLAIFLLRSFLLKKPSEILYYKATREDLVDSVSVSGNFEVASNIPVDTPTTGIITKLYVENGDSVEVGDELFYILATATEQEKAAAYADYQAALASYENAQNTLRDKETILDNVYDTVQGHDNDESYAQRQSRTTAEVAKDIAYQNVLSVKAALAEARLAYDETKSTTVKAKSSGKIVNLLDKVGDQVNAVGEDKPVLSIVDFSGPHIMITISENYAPRIKSGQKVNIIFDSLKSQSFEGVVETLDSVGSIFNGIVSYGARVSVSNLPSEIKPGMSAIVNIETLRKNDVLAVPNSALIKEDGKNFIYLKKNFNKKVEVQIGEIGLTKTEVVSGIVENEIIIANPSNI